MRNLFKIKVEGILAPMIESRYSFKNYVKTALELLKDYGIRPMLSINAETYTFYQNMEVILSDPYFERIDSVTVGRGDLSASMEKEDVEDKEVTFVASEIIKAVREKGKITSVGGKVMPSNIYNIKDNIKSHRANTRHVVISLEKDTDLKEACAKALHFEIKLYGELMKVEPLKANSYKKRIEETKKRIAKDYARASLIA
jgi:5'-3' exonuclease